MPSPTSGNQHQSLDWLPRDCPDPQAPGIDTVRLSGPVSGTDWVGTMADKVTETSIVDAVTGEVERWFMWVQGDLPFKIEVSGDTTTLVTECSLPRRRNGSNMFPLTANHARDEVLDVYHYFDPHAGWRVPVEALRVRRLDATVDFTGVTDLPRLLAALASVSTPGERRNPGLFYDRERGGALTMCRGSREYERSLIYDKAAEVRHRHGRAARGGHPRPSWEISASVDIARFETQARSRYLVRQGVHTVADMTQGAVDRLAQRAWDRHALGTHVADAPTVLRAIQGSGLSATKQGGLLRHVLFERYDMDCDTALGTCNGHRNEIRRLGLTLDELDGRRPETWLDFEARRQISRATEN